ncbi:GntR family transcriptional regulator [Nonomuraea angiospora]|uniref:GntR family transcriptional regulator n=1 Tax=Nonomuraea angiospora TaxID=46172 RepID=UPI0033259435
MAITEIRRRITTGELPPEVSFSEATLCEELGMSRAPVREALIVLNQLGWVTSQPRSGYLVAPMTLNDLRDLYTMRSLLEPKAAAQAVRQIEELPDEAGSLSDFSANHDDPSDPEWLNRHYRFHRRIVVVGLNREMDRVLSEVLLKLERYFLIDAVQRALAEEPLAHHDLANAIVSGDHKAAADAAALHISQSRVLVTEAILSSDGIRSMPLSRSAGSPPRGAAQ